MKLVLVFFVFVSIFVCFQDINITDSDEEPEIFPQYGASSSKAINNDSLEDLESEDNSVSVKIEWIHKMRNMTLRKVL